MLLAANLCDMESRFLGLYDPILLLSLLFVEVLVKFVGT